MQRKNRILRSHKNAMAMIMAIAVIVIIATIMALALSMTALTSKKTNDLYLYEQAVLLSKSATEYTLLRIAQANPCTITNLNFTQDVIYDINISLRYVYTAGTACADIVIETPEQNGSVIMDVSVSVNDTSIVSEPIRYFRRTIQKL